MTEITHQHTERPHYEATNGETVNQWDRETLEHAVSRPDYGEVLPVVFDIETTAETPQRPILVTAYDAADRTVEIAYQFRHDEYRPEHEELEALVRENFGEVPVDDVIISSNVSQAWFERRVLSRVLNEPNKALVGHNVSFDLGILASPNWQAIERLGLDPNQWDGAMTFKDVLCTFKRAGAFGRIYAFKDTSSGGGAMTANVVDTQTAAQSLWLPSSLDGLAEHYGLGGIDADEHGRLSDEYVAYNVDDVRQTVQAFYCLTEELQDGFDTDMTLNKVYSTASVAKDVLTRMDYDRSHYTEQAASVIPQAYFGGRTEALKTGELIEGVTYMDILSQYPTVCGLTEVWDTMRAETVDVQHVETESLPQPTAADLREAETWPEVAPYYVKVDADGAVLPVRTQAFGDTTRVYTAEVTHDADSGTWYHYMDVLAAELLGDAEYSIEAAVEVVTEGEQHTTSTSVGGRTFEADSNVMVRGIEERKAVQAVNGGKNTRTKCLKITANSCYGIAAERIVEDTVENGEIVDRHDVAGKFYNPHVASTITAGGRLQLALGEHAAEAAGGSLYYCDTDSLIVDEEVADAVQDALSGLNPYEAEPVCDAEVLEIEEGKDGRPLADVDLLAVGVKKYCILDDGEPVKWTEHGLGHYSNLRDDAKVQRFWSWLLSQQFGVYCSGDMLTPEELSEPVIWQQGASTEPVRRAINEHLSDEFRYGDWVEKMILTGGAAEPDVYYIGIDITEEALRVQHYPDGTVEQDVLSNPAEQATDSFKTVNTVVNNWWLDGDTGTDGRRTVTITSHEAVTKEATGVRLAWNQALRAACQAALDLLFDG